MELIRVCSLPLEVFCKEVIPTKVLSPQEVMDICMAMGLKQKPTTLTEVCSEVEVRKGSQEVVRKVVKSSIMRKEFNLSSYCYYGTTNYNFSVKTHTSKLELVALTVRATHYGLGNMLQFNFVVSVEQVGNPQNKTSVTFSGHNLYGDVKIPVSTEGRELLLLPNTEYKVTITCNQQFNGYAPATIPDTNNFSITAGTNTSGGSPCFPVKQIEYRTIG